MKDGTGVMKRFLAAAVSAAILFAVTGCAGGENTAQTDSSISAGSVSQAEEVLTESESTEPKDVKAVALSRNAARMWMLAGGELIAAADEAQDLPGIPKDLVWIGSENEPDLKNILKTETDVVIVDRSVENYSGIKKELSEAECDMIEVSANSFRDYDASMQLLTERTGNAESYQKYVTEVAARNEGIISNALEAAHKIEVTVTEPPARDVSDTKVSDEAANQYYKGRTPTYMVVRVGSEGCCAMSNDDFICSMLCDFGMTNANKSGQRVHVWKMSEEETSKVEDSVATQSGDSRAEKGKVADSSVMSKLEDSRAEKGEAEDSSATPKPNDVSTASLIPEAPVETDAVDTFAGEVDARESTDAGRRTFDNLLANNPDFIFIIYEGNEKEAVASCNELVKSCDSWKDVFAVKSGRVYELPQSSFRYQPDELWDMAYEYLYQTIYNL
jgi:ABC-type Fe3+-hydroxamate transport system substrate-binding protein